MYEPGLTVEHTDKFIVDRSIQNLPASIFKLVIIPRCDYIHMKILDKRQNTASMYVPKEKCLHRLK